MMNIGLNAKTRAQNASSKVLSCLICFALLTSCASVYYPSSVNSSFIETKGETNAGAALSFTSINAQASKALGNHLRLAGSVNYWGWNVTLGNSSTGESGFQSQLLSGYYTRLGERSYFEGYGGIGYSFTDDDQFAHVIFQPSIGFGRNQPKFTCSLRTSFLTNELIQSSDNNLELDELKISGFYYDLAFTHRFHRKQKYWFLQYGLSTGDIQQDLGESEALTFINFGVNFKFPGKLKELVD